MPFGGRTNSSTTARPLVMRRISRRPRIGLARLRRPKAIVDASKVASSKGRFSASPSRNSISGCVRRAISSMRGLKSRPTTRPPSASFASSAVSLPEPHATSSADPPARNPVSRAARRRHPASVPADSTVLTVSYRCAIRSNIDRTACGSRSLRSSARSTQCLVRRRCTSWRGRTRHLDAPSRVSGC